MAALCCSGIDKPGAEPLEPQGSNPSMNNQVAERLSGATGKMREGFGAGVAGAKGFGAGLGEKMLQGCDPLPPPGKSDLMVYGCADGQPEDSPFVKTLEFRLANDYRWSENIFCDYFFFVCQWHPIIGIVMCHPNHPWTKMERLTMILISLALTAPSSCWVTQSTCSLLPGQLPENLFDKNGKCMGAENELGKTLMTIFCVTLPDTVIGVFLYQLSIAHTRCPGTCSMCLGCFHSVKKACMGYSLFLGLCSTLLCYKFIELQTPEGEETHWDTILPATGKVLLEGKILSWVYVWFPMWMFLPCMGYLHQWYCMEAHDDGTKTGAPETPVE